MNITPDTNIRLLKCPLKLDNKNQITFASVSAQTTYFLSLPHLEVEGSMYQRKDSSIFYPALYDDLIEYNYVMYQNENYSNKWFYAFIVGMEYLNDNTTKIGIATDSFQTWQFDITYKASFVEREMINVWDDVAGANLVPENLETGEYKVAATATVSELSPVYVWAYSDSKLKVIDVNDPQTITEYDFERTTNPFVGVHNVNGIYNSLFYIVASSPVAYGNMIKSLALDNQSEKVIAHFTVPSLAVNTGNAIDFTAGNHHIDNFYLLGQKATATTKTLNSRPTALDNHTAVNAKLLTYPYVYVGFNPPQGSSKVYRYEDFTNGTPVFKFISEVNPNPSVYVIPQNYRGDTGDSMQDKCSLNGYPQVSSKVDVYNSWVAENSGIINVQANQAYGNLRYDTAIGTAGLVGTIGSTAMSAMGDVRAQQIAESKGREYNEYSGGGSGGLAGIASSALAMYKNQYNYDYYIKMIQAQNERQQILPDNVSLGGSNATLLGYDLMDNNIFTRYNIKQQFAERIDDYFSMFGYQTNKLKVPNIHNRKFWNYVKTQGINLLGNIPNSDLNNIKSLFDSGITLWHNPTYFLDYSQNNHQNAT